MHQLCHQAMMVSQSHGSSFRGKGEGGVGEGMRDKEKKENRGVGGGGGRKEEVFEKNLDQKETIDYNKLLLK